MTPDQPPFRYTVTRIDGRTCVTDPRPAALRWLVTPLGRTLQYATVWSDGQSSGVEWVDVPEVRET